MDSWTTGRLVLLGDAVHPFLPHQGQGGAVAIEDSVALGIVLGKGLSRDDVVERLQLYQKIRKERADTLQHFTRLSGEDLKPGETTSVDYQAITAYNFGFDEFDNSTQRLREWKWSRQPASYWRMPIVSFSLQFPAAFSSMELMRWRQGIWACTWSTTVHSRITSRRFGLDICHIIDKVQDLADCATESSSPWIEEVEICFTCYCCVRVDLANHSQRHGMAGWYRLQLHLPAPTWSSIHQ
jgi:hypothetical protein